MSERIFSVILILVSAFFAFSALQIEKPMFSDPIGPALVPLLIALLLAGTALSSLLKPTAQPRWPQAAMLLRLGLTAVVFLCYAVLVEPLGFVPATVLAFAAFAVLFHAAVGKALLAGAVFAVVAWLLFGLALDLYLPTGTLIERWL